MCIFVNYYANMITLIVIYHTILLFSHMLRSKLDAKIFCKYTIKMVMIDGNVIYC